MLIEGAGHRMRGWAVLIAVAASACLAEGGELTGAASARFVGGAAPLEAEQRLAAGLTTNASAGLFVGVSQFAPNSGLGALAYAVDDAVALAEVFVTDLQLLPPRQVTLALGGQPTTAAGRQRLASLRAAGVQTRDARRDTILDALLDLADRTTDPQGLTVLSFSSHGYEEGGVYVMPENGRRRLVRDTGIPLATVERTLRQARANKVLLILDACRGEETRGEGMSEAFFKALSAAEGFGVLLSCGVNQLSYEAPELGHGVYTHFLLEALRGGARAEPNALILLDGVARYAGEATTRWVETNKGARQTPAFSGPETARRIPLAVDLRILEAQRRIEAERVAAAQQHSEARRKLQERKAQASRLLLEARQAHNQSFPLDVKQQVESALESIEGAPLARLLAQIELMKELRLETVESFLAWWQVNSNGLTAGTKAPPVVYGEQLARYTNSLGMVFIAVPGTRAKFGIWETRVTDFRAFVQATSYDAREDVYSTLSEDFAMTQGANWEEPGFPQTELHPVCGVSWLDGQAFCRWLTDKEQREGRISRSAAYRLPRDSEWSAAAGPGKYVWGGTWPPRERAGNFAGDHDGPPSSDGDSQSSASEQAPTVITLSTGMKVIKGYRDGFAETSPVGSFVPSSTGLHDLEGNVSEWCEDWYQRLMNTPEARSHSPLFDRDGDGRQFRVTRGAAWTDSSPVSISAGLRRPAEPGMRETRNGFRCVLDPGRAP